MRIVALDIGGTSIKSGIWNGKEATELKERDTNARLGGQKLMETVIDIIKTYDNFEAIGISTAGQVDTENGSICYANENIPGYTGTKVKEILEKEFSVPVAVENDVNAAAYGELCHGAGKDLDSFLCLTYGTGVGGAIVMDRKIYHGSTYAGASFGGIIVHPEDLGGKAELSGCYEKYASTTALVEKTMAINPELSNGRAIFEEINNSDIRNIVDEWINEIVYGLVTLIHIFNPTDIILGGGILAQSYVINKIKMLVFKHVYPQARQVRIRQAMLGNAAGITGAGVLAEELIGK